MTFSIGMTSSFGNDSVNIVAGGYSSVDWFIYEQGDRWSHSIRRFAPDLFPAIKDVSIFTFDTLSVPRMETHRSRAANRARRSIVLWEVNSSNYRRAAIAIAQTSIAVSRTLQIAATSEVSPMDQMVLSEFGIAVSIRHPEQLPDLGPLIRGHFARPA